MTSALPTIEDNIDTEKGVLSDQDFASLQKIVQASSLRSATAQKITVNARNLVDDALESLASEYSLLRN
jgi:hypothetical protein